MFSSHKFYNLTTSFSTRGKCFGASSNVKATNAANERIAENTNNSNAEINRQTNETNLQIQRETNAANIQMNEENNRLQQKLQDEMNAFNYRMWQENNEYNSPLQQLERAKDAGINPNSALGNAVASTPVQQVSLPQTTPGHADAAQVQPFEYQGYTAIPARKDELELMSEFANQLNSSADTMGKVLANQNQSYVNDFAPAMLAAGLQGKKIGNELTKKNVEKVGQDMQESYMRCQGIAQNILQSRAQIREINANVTGMSYDNFQKMIKAWYSPQREEAEINNLVSQTGCNKAQAKYLYTMGGVEMMKARAYVAKTNSDIEVNNSQIRVNNENAEFLKVQAKARQQYLDAGGTQLELRQMDAAIRLNVANADKQEMENMVYREYGEDIAKAELKEKEWQSSDIKHFLDGAESVTRSAANASIAYKNIVSPDSGASGPEWNTTGTFNYDR